MKTVLEGKRGDKVMFAYPENGYPHDVEDAAKYLVHGNTYTVDHVDVGNWASRIYLIEIEGRSFNTVQFKFMSNAELPVLTEDFWLPVSPVPSDALLTAIHQKIEDTVGHMVHQPYCASCGLHRRITIIRTEP